MDRIECVVIGAGVVGLAIAREMAMAGREVIVLEAGPLIGEGTSSRNSEVIHAGIYYPAGSLKARLCVEGKNILYDYCARRGIAHQRCGKLIVATSQAQVAQLETLRRKAVANGVPDLRQIDAAELRRLEPDVRGAGALLSPSTGIIDSHGLMLSLQGEAEAHGALVALRTPFARAEAGRGYVVTTGGEDAFRLRCDLLINSAGLAAPSAARAIGGLDPAFVPEAFMAKGSYFGLSGVRAPFRHLIYPVPEAHGLGVHLTLDLAGQARFGPDVEWVGAEKYDVDPQRSESFYAAIRRYWPSLPDDALVPAYAGIRPKIGDAAMPAADFRIDGPGVHGLPGLVNLFGIESPGLTASMAIARRVRELLT